MRKKNPAEHCGGKNVLPSWSLGNKILAEHKSYTTMSDLTHLSERRGTTDSVCVSYVNTRERKIILKDKEGEVFSVVFGIRKFHQYLYGRRKSVLATDPVSGPKTRFPTPAAARMQRWVLHVLPPVISTI